MEQNKGNAYKTNRIIGTPSTLSENFLERLDQNIFNEVLTKDESGTWSHCGFTMKSGLCNECDSETLDDACFTLYCRECGFHSPDCADEALDALLVLAVI